MVWIPPLFQRGPDLDPNLVNPNIFFFGGGVGGRILLSAAEVSEKYHDISA